MALSDETESVRWDGEQELGMMEQGELVIEIFL